MTRITILELLNRSTEKEIAPKRVICNDKVFYYDEQYKEYYYQNDKEETYISLLEYIYCEEELNLCYELETDYKIITQRVEIIEE